MKQSTRLFALLLAFICFYARFAYAEYAWVETPKGPLNLRAQADSDADIIERIPNGELIEFQQASPQWSRVTYANVDGYVKTSYLKPAAQMIGKAIYPDGDYLYVRQKAEENAESVAVVRAAQALTILEIDGLWAKVSCINGEHEVVQGYVNIEHISEQREEPDAQLGTTLDVHVELSADILPVGDVLDVSVQCSGEATYQYCLYKDGEVLFEGEPVVHSRASYRPRESGRYRLEVIVHDDQNLTVGCEAYFDVTATPSDASLETFEVYSQRDGWWRDKPYGNKNLESAGCAIFTLAHALQAIGHNEDAAKPDQLGRDYSAYLVESGTLTSRLLAGAAEAFDFVTSEEKIDDPARIAQGIKEGAVFSFLVVKNHVALAAGLSDDGTMVRIVDSSYASTFERIQNAKLYYLDAQGSFQAVQAIWDMPGARYYFETDTFGGLEYYLELDYVASRGARLIRPNE